jgi:shikimate kinase
MLDLPIFMTGFMGVGKTKIGQRLAHNLERRFLDTDEMIEARAGKPISAIFADEGEDHFRQLEHECVAEAASMENAVISLGGGAIAQQRNLDLVHRSGVLVCIEADVETILHRVSRRDDRPLLSGLNRDEKREKIETMLAQRAQFYDQADVKVQSTDERSPEATALILLESLEHWSAERRNSAR